MVSMVSILMPVYNREGVVHEAIESVLSQKFSNFEFLILNDGSSDNTLSVLHKYRKMDERIVVINNDSNMGVNFCRNRLIRESSKELICWIDSDDLIDENKISSQVRELCRPGVDIVFSNYVFFRHGQNPRSKRVYSRVKESDIDVLNKSKEYSGNENLCFASMMCKKSVFSEIKFDDNICAGGDAVWINEALKKYPFFSTKETVYHIRRHNDRITFKKKEKRIIERGEDPYENQWILANNVSIIKDNETDK